jgi:glycosyltransferase involved in cell wall biosynthesis
VRETNAIFVTWTPHHRATEIARAVGGAIYEPSPGRTRWPAPIRYTLQSLQTLFHVFRRRPGNVLFTNPPFVTGIVLLTVRWALRFEIWSDCHSGAFNDPRWARFSGINRWVMRRCAGVVVTNGRLAESVRMAGARPLVLNYPSSVFKTRKPAPDPYLVATVGYMFDEPIQELLEAAKRVPQVRLFLTGDPPAEVRAHLPLNCTLTGWLPRAAYEKLLAGARGVICLTSREDTMQTGAYEALEYALPLLLSGTQVLRDFFSQGVIFVDDHSPEALAHALQQLWTEHERLSNEAVAERHVALPGFQAEVRELVEALEDSLPTRAAPDTGGKAEL